ncbi:MAG: PBP1A family penicillin-binding protein [Sporolactobacillus sp.]
MVEYRSRMEKRQAASKGNGGTQQPAAKHAKKGAGGGKRKRSWFKRILIIILLAFLFAVLAGAVFIYLAIRSAPALSSDALHNEISSILYDDQNKQAAVVDAGVHRLYANINSIPLSVQDAFISTEDLRFYQHFGIDPIRIAGAAVAQFTHGYKSEGGSTIDQQVVRNAMLTQNKTFTRKIQEAYLAIQLDKHYTKKQILEMYLNQIYLGEGPTYGVAAASELYFGKNIKNVDLAQSAMLAAMTRNPGYYNPLVHPAEAKARRDLVINLMLQNHAIDKAQADQAKSESIAEMTAGHQSVVYSDRKYGAFIDYVRHVLVDVKKVVTEKEFDSGGLKIYTTLDPSLQQQAQNVLSDSNLYKNVRDNFQAGVSIIDTQTGAIRALGGGRNYAYLLTTNHSYQNVGSVGSTAKPIVDYGPAIEYLKWPTDYALDDKDGVRYSSSNNSGKIINDWDGKYMGPMSMRTALYLSRNVPAVETLQAVDQAMGSTRPVISFANKLGMNFSPSSFDESYAIGSFFSSPLTMSGAFAAFGNNGVYNAPFAVRKIVKPDGEVINFKTTPTIAMHDYTAYMVTNMLKDVMTKGTGVGANIPGANLAGKTGTQNIDSAYAAQVGIPARGVSSGAMDAWFVGYTTRLTAAIWTGYDVTKQDIAAKRYQQSNFGTYLSADEQSYAKLIFKNIMSDYVIGSQDFKQPSSVVSLGGGELGVVNSSVANHFQSSSSSSAPSSSSALLSSSSISSSSLSNAAPVTNNNQVTNGQGTNGNASGGTEGNKSSSSSTSSSSSSSP